MKNTPVVTSDVIGDELIREDPKVFEGMYQSQSVNPNFGDTQIMMEAYRKKYNKKPAYPLFTAWGFDAYGLVFECAHEDHARTSEEFRTVPAPTSIRSRNSLNQAAARARSSVISVMSVPSAMHVRIVPAGGRLSLPSQESRHGPMWQECNPARVSCKVTILLLPREGRFG